MGYESFIAFRHLRGRHRSRFISVITLISIAGVFVGVAATDIVISVMNGFQAELRQRLLGVNAHVVVLRYFEEGISDYDSLAVRIKGFSHVTSAEPFIYSKAVIRARTQADGIVVRGLVPGSRPEVLKHLVEGTADFGKTPDGILLGSDLAERLRVGVGDSVSLISPFKGTETPLGFVPKVGRFPVIGIFNLGFYEYDASLAFLSLFRAQQFFDMGNTVTGIEVRLDNLDLAAKKAKEIAAGLGYPYRTNDWIQLNQNLFSALKLEKLTMFVILSLIVLVAAFNIIATLIMIVVEKTRDIGILKAMGATGRSIRRIFIWEGLAVGVGGTLLGTGIGALLSWLVGKYRFISIPGEVYFLDRLPARLVGGDLLTVALVALLISFLATIYPAWKASQLEPVEAIRYE
jgi:lipoprotein-releasing system permease protein